MRRVAFARRPLVMTAHEARDLGKFRVENQIGPVTRMPIHLGEGFVRELASTAQHLERCENLPEVVQKPGEFGKSGLLGRVIEV